MWILKAHPEMLIAGVSKQVEHCKSTQASRRWRSVSTTPACLLGAAGDAPLVIGVSGYAVMIRCGFSQSIPPVLQGESDLDGNLRVRAGLLGSSTNAQARSDTLA
jgi:hypothetical protein